MITYDKLKRTRPTVNDINIGCEGNEGNIQDCKGNLIEDFAKGDYVNSSLKAEKNLWNREVEIPAHHDGI